MGCRVMFIDKIKQEGIERRGPVVMARWGLLVPDFPLQEMY